MTTNLSTVELVYYYELAKKGFHYIDNKEEHLFEGDIFSQYISYSLLYHDNIGVVQTGSFVLTETESLDLETDKVFEGYLELIENL